MIMIIKMIKITTIITIMITKVTMIQKVITDSDTNNNDYNKMFSNDNDEKSYDSVTQAFLKLAFYNYA